MPTSCWLYLKVRLKAVKIAILKMSSGNSHLWHSQLSLSNVASQSHHLQIPTWGFKKYVFLCRNVRAFSKSFNHLLKVSKCQAVYPRNVKVLINCKCNRFFTAHAFLHCGWFWLHRKKTFLESKTYVIYDALILMMLIALSLFILQLEKVFFSD